MSKVAVLIVTHNSVPYLNRMLESLKISIDIAKQASIHVDLWVYDNKSSDSTIDILTKYEITYLHKSSTNDGFGYANNSLISKVEDKGYEFYFLLNHDVYVEPDTIVKLFYVAISHGKNYVYSPTQVALDGELDRDFATYITNKDFLLEENHDFKVVKFVNAASWFICATIVKKIGLFNNMFYHYGEDNEYANRLNYNNIYFIVIKNTVVHDRPKMQTFKKKYGTFKITNLMLVAALDINTKNFFILDALRQYFKYILVNPFGYVRSLLVLFTKYYEIRKLRNMYIRRYQSK
jgi:GT2 family glycosyltransferase